MTCLSPFPVILSRSELSKAKLNRSRRIPARYQLSMRREGILPMHAGCPISRRAPGASFLARRLREKACPERSRRVGIFPRLSK
jgi:hypothetical protein